MNQGHPPYPQGSPFGSDEAPVPPQYVRVRPPARTPIVAYSLLAITVAIYLLQMATQYLLGLDYPAALGLKVNQLIIQGQYWRLLVPIFLHGSILHIGFNMYALLIFGPGLERQFGHARFLALYLLGGFGGNVISFLFSSAPSLGSSTAIFGLLGAESVFLYQNRALYGKTAQRAIVNIATIAGINLLIGLSPGIDNWGHVGGLIGGTLFAWFGGPLLRVEGIFPTYITVDTRRKTDVVLAGVGVALLFALLAGYKIYLQGGTGL